MKVNPNRIIFGIFGLVILVGVGAKMSGDISAWWEKSNAEQARIEAEAQEQEEKLALEKAEAEVQAKSAKATVVRLAEEYGAQKTGTGAYRRPGDGYKFTLEEKDAYGMPVLLLYDRGAIVDSFKVRSAGPDKKYYTDDDIIEEKWSANGAGAVDGVKASAGDLLQSAKDKIFGGKKE